VALETSDVLEPETIKYLKKLTDLFESLPEVESVLSLTNVEDLFGSEEDFVVEPLIGERTLLSPQEREWVRKRILKNPLMYGSGGL
jgi:predicted RND superfamily exporter protein